MNFPNVHKPKKKEKKKTSTTRMHFNRSRNCIWKFHFFLFLLQTVLLELNLLFISNIFFSLFPPKTQTAMRGRKSRNPSTFVCIMWLFAKRSARTTTKKKFGHISATPFRVAQTFLHLISPLSNQLHNEQGKLFYRTGRMLDGIAKQARQTLRIIIYREIFTV